MSVSTERKKKKREREGERERARYIADHLCFLLAKPFPNTLSRSLFLAVSAENLLFLLALSLPPISLRGYADRSRSGNIYNVFLLPANIYGHFLHLRKHTPSKESGESSSNSFATFSPFPFKR